MAAEAGLQPARRGGLELRSEHLLGEHIVVDSGDDERGARQRKEAEVRTHDPGRELAGAQAGSEAEEDEHKPDEGALAHDVERVCSVLCGSPCGKVGGAEPDNQNTKNAKYDGVAEEIVRGGEHCNLALCAGHSLLHDACLDSVKIFFVFQFKKIRDQFFF